MVRRTLKILLQLLEDIYRVPDGFRKLCNKDLNRQKQKMFWHKVLPTSRVSGYMKLRENMSILIFSLFLLYVLPLF